MIDRALTARMLDVAADLVAAARAADDDADPVAVFAVLDLAERITDACGAAMADLAVAAG